MPVEIWEITLVQEQALLQIAETKTKGLHSSMVFVPTAKVLVRKELIRPHSTYPGYYVLAPEGDALVACIKKSEE